MHSNRNLVVYIYCPLLNENCSVSTFPCAHALQNRLQFCSELFNKLYCLNKEYQIRSPSLQSGPKKHKIHFEASNPKNVTSMAPC